MKKATILKSIQYLILTTMISWISWGSIILANQFGYLEYGTGLMMALLAIGGCAPAIATVILLIKQGNIKNVKDFSAFLFKKGSLLRTIIVILIIFSVYWIIFANCYNRNTAYAWYYFITFIPVMMIGGGFEEIGWRGYLQPELEKIIPSGLISIVVGVIWACWHIPLWFISGTSQHGTSFLSFTVLTIFLSCILAAIRKITDNVFAAVLFHTWSNVLYNMYRIESFSIKFLILLSVAAIATYIIYIYVSKKDSIAKISTD